MKKKKIIIISLILSIALIGTTKLSASTANNWAQGLPNIARGEFYRCTGSNCTNIGLNNNGLTLEDGSVRRIFTTPNINFDRPVIFQFPTGSLKTGYLYLGEVYICGSKNYSDSTYTMYAGPYSTPLNSSSKQVLINYMGMNKQPGIEITYNLCRLYSGLFVPNEAVTWASFKLDPNTATNDINFSIISYNIKELGIYGDTIKSIIDESNGSVTNAVDKVNETLNKDHEYNKDASVNTEEDKNKFNNYEQQEDNLRNGLNLDIEDSQITIDPNANNFIWETINKLRTMSPKIVLLFTSVLSLGLMKMILGR